MAIEFKYRIHEVAKDFGFPTKQVMEMYTDYFSAPKNHMQILEANELNVIFELITQSNQISNIAEVFAPSAPAAVKEESKAAPVSSNIARPVPQNTQNARGNTAPRNQKGGNNQPANRNNVQSRPAVQNTGRTPVQTTAQSSQSKPKDTPAFQPKRVAEKRVIDTRNSSAANLSKYDEKFDNMAGERALNMRQGKEKITSKNKQRNDSRPNNSRKRQEEEARRKQQLQLESARKAQTKVMIPDEISVGELASRMKKTAAEVIKQLIKLGVFASVSDVIDYDTAALVAMELNCKVEKEVIVTKEELLIDTHEDKEEDLIPRAPVVVVMGHVDHGKTSLLDYIRKSSVASGEAGGITQAIGAYTVEVNGKPVTFLDTPGHEAFTTMRARGAMVTDVAILVVAADDGIMPQTIESISHAKAANTPIVVAVNKMDLPGASPDRIMQDLTKYDLVPEAWGGETIVCPISAKTGMGIEDLLENLTLQAEIMELKANPNRAASGSVIEARLDKGRGPIMTVLVQNGTLHQGDIIIAGTATGRVRVMINDKGERITSAGPSEPVEIMGMDEVPAAGDIFNCVSDERMARQLAEERKEQQKTEAAAAASKKVSLEDLFARIQEGAMKNFNIIVKADVQGSAEAVKASLEKISNSEVQVRVIHSAVGAITESDVMLASTSGAVIIGFNVRPEAAARDSAVRNNVELRMYRVIYDCINDVEAAMKGMLAPSFQEVLIGHAEVRQTYHVSKVGTICGCYVTDGKIQRNCKVRVLRDNIVIVESELASLQRFKDAVKEVATGYECGMTIEKFNDIKEGDVIECFVMEEVKR